MVLYEDECVDCPQEIGCLGACCPKKNVPHYYCDECDDETTLYDFDGEQLCADCLLKRFDIVQESQ